ncbi:MULTISPECIES: hypothetical protein [Photorhabdus]|uniref:hypothetical protein n=1 Tax=Photorhabdus TaxID=29487 RepID=UPI000DCD3A04|nr:MULTISPECIES: hypothetical protein [Photorhabdus]MCT8341299.1 hypothetical protein [Photorhabdus kleinii]RAW93788.1 hypothetical protein CKY03_21700 [Photorhabdus sp. S9-53]RAW93857.1 hypothetical protein CKY05_21610 [Photorhabdus sp. S10-54]RAW97267.1 hypothetical protein CKY04_21505 [Photorhabdus sp. S8-52]
MIVYIPFILMVLSLLGFLACFIYFGLSRKVSLRSVKSPLLFFDFCFFNKNKLANFSMMILFIVYISGIWFEFIKNGSLISFTGYFIGVFAILVFFIHCRFFSKIKFAHRNNIEFIKEFVFEIEISGGFD